MRVKHLAGLALLILILAAGLVWALNALHWSPPLPGFELSADAVEAHVRSWGAWGVAGAIGLMIIHSFVPFPAEVVAMANGMIYGPVWGTLITWVGAMLGAYLAFGLARWLGRPLAHMVIPERHQRRLDGWASHHGGLTLLVSRLLPVISFNLINYAAGLTSISWWTFTWATGLGILPLTILMVLVGAKLLSGESHVWAWLLLAALSVWVLWWLFRRWRNRSQASS